MKRFFVKALAALSLLMPTSVVAGECIKYVSDNYSPVSQSRNIEANVCVTVGCEELVDSVRSRKIDDYYEVVIKLKQPRNQITLANLPPDAKLYTTDKTDSCIRGDLLENVTPQALTTVSLHDCDKHIKVYTWSYPNYRIVTKTSSSDVKTPSDIDKMVLLKQSETFVYKKKKTKKQSSVVITGLDLRVFQPVNDKLLELPDLEQPATPYPDTHWNLNHDKLTDEQQD